MKLRYQMRGLGIGMIVTALLMGLTAEKVPLSDAEIRARAAELGMIESDALKLTDIQNVPAGSPSPEQNGAGETEFGTANSEPDSEESRGASGEEEQPGSEGASGEEEQPGSEGASGEEEQPGSGGSSGEAGQSGPEGTSGEEGQPDSRPAGEMVTITVEPGITSYRVCIMLEEAGLVEDAAEFDTYLCENGYSRKIDSGTYEIPMGISEEEIAKMITRNR